MCNRTYTLVKGAKPSSSRMSFASTCELPLHFVVASLRLSSVRDLCILTIKSSLQLLARPITRAPTMTAEDV